MPSPPVVPPDFSLAAVKFQQECTCPVCGTRVQPPVVACPDCATPHHQDCWKYNQGCAIFGCAEHAERGLAVRPPSMPEASSACPVCSQPVRGEAIRCAACQSRHHRRCFERDGRCGQRGCPLAGDAHPGAPLPEKILLPQVAMAFFSGLYYFPPIFALWCMFWVAFAPVLFGNPVLAAVCYGLVAAGFVAGGMWSDRYNLDLKERALTRSWLIGSFEILETRVLDLDRISELRLDAPGDHVGPVALHAVLRSGLFSRSIALTPGMRPGTRQHQEIERLLWKLHAFSIVRVAPLMLAVPTSSSRPTAR